MVALVVALAFAVVIMWLVIGLVTLLDSLPSSPDEGLDILDERGEDE